MKLAAYLSVEKLGEAESSDAVRKGLCTFYYIFLISRCFQCRLYNEIVNTLTIFCALIRLRRTKMYSVHGTRTNVLCILDKMTK